MSSQSVCQNSNRFVKLVLGECWKYLISVRSHNYEHGRHTSAQNTCMRPKTTMNKYSMNKYNSNLLWNHTWYIECSLESLMQKGYTS